MTFEPLYTATELRDAEERHPGFPATAGELMERAGAAVAFETRRAFPEAHRVAVVCGRGANGGDGRIAARFLREAGVEAVETDEPEGFDVVVDALLGTGFHGEMRAETATVIDRINRCGAPVVSIDLPSGVDGSTGETRGAAVRADLVVTFHGQKLGLAVAPGRFHANRIVIADLGLPQLPTRARRVTEEILAAVPLRGPGDTKRTAGHVVVVGGSPGMTGAAVLAARAALRADAGYVTVCVPSDSLATVEALALEAVVVPFDAADAFETVVAAARGAGAVALGPGLGRSEEHTGLVRRLLATLDLPIVVDADALGALEPGMRAAPTVITPHAGEAARMLGLDTATVSAGRLASAEALAATFGAVALLKGADTIVQAPGSGPLICDYGPPSLATAGTGDVLTGIVAAFLAKGLEPVHAAAAAAVAHGLAAASLPHRAGVIASDVVEALPSVLDRARALT